MVVNSLIALGLELQPQALPDPIPVETLLVPLATALGLAVIVERAVELGKNVVDLVPTAAPGRAVRNPGDLERPLDELEGRHRADQDRRRVERSERDRAGDVEKLRRIEAQLRDRDLEPGRRATLAVTADTMRGKLRAVETQTEVEEALPGSLILVEPATDPDDGATLRAFLIHAVAMVAGIVAARVSGLQLFSALTGTPLPVGLDYLLTGLLIGGGSAPIHMLIRFITARKVAAPDVTGEPEGPPPRAGTATPPVPAAVRAEPAPATPIAPAAPADDWVEIGYDGGVDRDVLESVHRRRGNPDLIVYHHTAMPGDSSFEDLVRVIKGRRDSAGRPWITGYNCAVTADGAIHPFCRWDRYGNHAAGHNMRSLGLAVNGNFETDPTVPYSNPDGRYGRQRPTSAQIESSARVLALWCLVYDIPVVFGDTIIPHSQVSTKTCPGNNFPHEELERLVQHYHARWRGSERARARILAFRRKPFVLVEPIHDALLGADPVPVGHTAEEG